MFSTCPRHLLRPNSASGTINSAQRIVKGYPDPPHRNEFERTRYRQRIVSRAWATTYEAQRTAILAGKKLYFYRWSLRIFDPADLPIHKRFEFLDFIEDSFKFLQKLSFSGRVKGRNYGNINTTKVSKFNPHELWNGIEDIHRRLGSVQIENLPWREAIERYDRNYTVIYADPPYLGFNDYSHNFTIKDYEELADVAKSIEGTIFISHKEHPEIRKLFRAMDVREFPFDYSFQKGERKKVVELVFCNREILPTNHAA